MSRSSQALPGSLSSSDPMIDKPEARRFPSPWIAEETDACFIIRDHNGYALAYVYFEEEPGRQSAAKLLRVCPDTLGRITKFSKHEPN